MSYLTTYVVLYGTVHSQYYRYVILFHLKTYLVIRIVTNCNKLINATL